MFNVVETEFVVTAVTVVTTETFCGVTVAVKVADVFPAGITTVAGIETA